MNASLERKLTQSLPRMPNTEEGGAGSSILGGPPFLRASKRNEQKMEQQAVHAL